VCVCVCVCVWPVGVCVCGLPTQIKLLVTSPNVSVCIAAIVAYLALSFRWRGLILYSKLKSGPFVSLFGCVSYLACTILLLFDKY
jgi:hypothetical protein